mmetsp:Transcript_19069/g.43224  ORF Transcript_19069/g.43224 Transcript_19069/m.43224 type:complete len:374 (+) Transcript_19069:975-2096(+)
MRSGTISRAQANELSIKEPLSIHGGTSAQGGPENSPHSKNLANWRLLPLLGACVVLYLRKEVLTKKNRTFFCGIALCFSLHVCLVFCATRSRLPMSLGFLLPQSTCSRPADGITEPTTVVVLSAGRRIEETAHIIEFYLFNEDRQLVPEVHLIWNSNLSIPLASRLLQNGRLRVFQESVNTLNNRYKHWRSIKTKSVLLLDDDCIVRDLKSAVRIHMLHPMRVTCFYARTHSASSLGTLKYMNPARINGAYSMCTGQASLLKTSFIEAFNTEANMEPVRLFIDQNRPTCEDIALHMFVSNRSRSPPVLVSAGQEELRWTPRTAMSGARGWPDRRRKCMSTFMANPFSGHMPLRYSEYTHPITYGDLMVGISSL